MLLGSGVAACAGQPGSAIPSNPQTAVSGYGGGALHDQTRVPKSQVQERRVYARHHAEQHAARYYLGFSASDVVYAARLQPDRAINKNGAVKEFTASPNVVNNIVTGRDGNIWFTQGGSDTIARMTPKGKITTFTVGNEAYGPFDICNGGDGNLWFTFRSPSTNAIGRMTPSGAVTLFTNGLSPGDIAVHDITEGPDGNVWFTEEFNNRIGSITPSGTITEYSDGISANAGLTDITAGPDGALWFAENSTNQIGRITTGGAVTEYAQGISPAGRSRIRLLRRWVISGLPRPTAEDWPREHRRSNYRVRDSGHSGFGHRGRTKRNAMGYRL